MSELKPCPCCASDRVDFITGHFVHATDQFSEGQSFSKVWCKRCQMRTGPEKTKKEAALIWNRRAVPSIGTRYRDDGGDVVAVVMPVEPQEQMLDAARALMMPGFSKTFDKARRHVSRYHGKDALASWPEWAMEGDDHIPKNARSELVYRMMLAALPEPE